MPDEEVRTILRNYGDSSAEIDHVLAGLSKIRSNIGLVESALDFADDTRNLIKLVSRLTEGDEDDPPNNRSVPRNDSHLENSTSVIESGHLEYPLGATHCCNGPASLEHFPHNGVSTSNSFAKMKDFEECLHPCETPRSLHTSRGSLQRQLALSTNQNIYSRVPSIRTDIFPNIVGSAPMTSQYLNHLTSANGFRTFGHTASPLISSFPWEGDVHLVNGGLSVPTTPVWSGKNASNLTVSPPSLNKSDRIVLTTEDSSPSSPRSKRFQPHTISYHTRDRGSHSRHPGTPPPKHRLKLIFPLHRSKSHESDLANRITPGVSNSIPNTAYPFESNRTNLVSPDASSNTNSEAFQCDVSTYSPVTTTFRSMNNSHLSPSSQTKCYAHGTYASSKTDFLPNPRLSVTINNSHSLDFIRRVSCDYRSPKTVWQPPTLMTTSVDGEGLVRWKLNTRTFVRVNSVPRSPKVKSSGFGHQLFSLSTLFGIGFIKLPPFDRFLSPVLCDSPRDCYSTQLPHSLATFFYIGLLASAGERIAVRLRRALFRSLVYREMAYFDVQNSGKLLESITSDVQTFKSSFKQCISHGLKNTVQSMFSPFQGIVLGVLYVGGHLISRDELKPGHLMSFLVTTQTVQRSLAQLSLLYGHVVRGHSALNRIFWTLRSCTVERNESLLFSRDPSLYTELCDLWRQPGQAPQLCFDAVQFAYPSRPKTFVLNELDMTIPAGKVVALVGHSGAGKSTVVSLIERFYDPSAGRIKLGDRDLRDFPLGSLRGQLVGYISQEPQIFNASIRENIRFGKYDATDVEVEEAARLANAHDFIVNQLPQGYDTPVGQSSDSTAGLSGGQRQRIAIARVLLKNAPILLLDEATSALDAESEAQVQEALGTVMKGRTCLIIAHRLSTVRRADLILVMSHGKIVEQGTHQDLMAKRGRYYDLVQRQESGDFLS
ncbi:ATP-binding cassette, subfamily B (MDR/TAP), member 8 [Paragonimus westermani]|uniref:Mitochondrial potassium channel ATP-binding subunit n=1 Tax=Paragonimus westermani TaxID=34504 RepID=A0A5J4NZS2_9TREM|nr:ATP-binding cassette, subfamily B (MDR/TAP), member 8 [Paragonimus westermani]